MANGTLHLAVGHATHTGLVREINEDSYLVLAPPAVSPPVDALLLVADGVGGANAGEVASGVLVESFQRWFRDNTYADHVHYNPGNPDYFIAALKDLLESVNERLYQMAASRPEWASMGTTGTVILLSNKRLYLGHVGDTRAYRLRGGALQQMTTDHSWVAEEVAAGRMTEAQAADHPRRNVISRVLGNNPLLRVDRTAHDVEPGDVLLLATDGLTGLVNDAEIRSVVMGARGLQEACHQLVNLANQRGGHDNVTVIAAQVVAGANSKAGSAGNGLGPDGVACQSVYLGRAAAPVPAATRAPASPRPAARAAAPPGTAPTVVMPAAAATPPRGGGGVGVRLGVLAALLLVGGALAYGAYSVVARGEAMPLGGLSLSPPLVAALCAALALLFGFLVGYIGRRWVTERPHR